jgi:hypothetical protein
MLIRIGYNIALRLFAATPVIFVLRVHPSRKTDLVEGEHFRVEPSLPVEDYFDSFQNPCGRVNAPSGIVRFRNDGVIRDCGEPDMTQSNPVERMALANPWNRSSFTVSSQNGAQTKVLRFLSSKCSAPRRPMASLSSMTHGIPRSFLTDEISTTGM